MPGFSSGFDPAGFNVSDYIAPGTISLRAVGAHTAANAAVTGLSPGVPAGLVTGDLSILTIQGKNATAGTAATVTTPTGWTLIASSNNGTLAPANDSGSNMVATCYRTDTYTAPSITTSGFNSAGAVIVAYSTNGTGWEVPVSTSGSDTASAANGSITGAGGLSVQTLDQVMVAVGVSGDIGTVFAQTIGGMSGATLAATTERVNAAVTTGNDSRTLVADCKVTAGTSTAAPTFAYTNTSSTTSHAQFLRLRATVPVVAAVKRRIGKRTY